MTTPHYDFMVIGGGSGGIASARRAAGYGARVAVFESGRLGGTCVNVGCVPKKIMWSAASIVDSLEDAAGYGISVDGWRLDWAQLVARREAFIQRLNGIYERNLDKDNVDLFRTHARLVGENSIEADDQHYSADRILIATGGQPSRPDIPGAELGIDSDGFFALKEQPRKVAIAGSGYIAVELASMLQRLGSEVTLVLRRNHVLRNFDAMLSENLLEHLQNQGIRIHFETQTERLEKTDRGVHAHFDRADADTFDQFIWAIGRSPNTAHLGLDAAGVATDKKGHIRVDDYQNTSADSVLALGDVTGRMELTPVAIAAGRRLGDRLFGGQPDRHLDYANIPSVVFTHPPIGTVGQTEQQAREEYGNEVRVYNSGFVALYYGVQEHKPRSAMKLVTVGKEERIVGAHIIGGGADEMLQGFAVAVRMGARKRDFDDSVAIHPTSAEEMVTMT